MKQVKNEQKFCGTTENFRSFLKTYGFRKVSPRFEGKNIFIDKNANMVRVYTNNRSLSNQGKIWWRYIPYDPTTCITNAGYKLVSINNHQFTMHQIMAHTWLYNPDPKVYTDIDHIDGCKTNNCLDNLRWCTKTENMQAYHERKNAGEQGLNDFIKNLKESSYIEYTPEKRLVLNLKLNKKEN